MKKIALFIILGLMSLNTHAQNADPGVSIIIAPDSIPMYSTAILSITAGNFGNDNILVNTLRLQIGVGLSATITGLEAGSDPRWTVVSLSSGPGNTITLRNTISGFTPLDVGDILVTVEGVSESTPDLILSHISYVTGNNPALNGAPNVSQGNVSTGNNNSQTSLTVTSNSNLPILLKNLSVGLEDDVVQGRWDVEIEENISHYEIEKSNDAIHFEHFSSLEATGQSTYFFTDDELTTKNQYYRLKIYNNDGSFCYSNIVSVKIESIHSHLLFNNIATDYLQLEDYDDHTDSNIFIYNILGQLMLQQTLPPEETSIGIDIHSLTEGYYYLVVNRGGEVFSEKFIVPNLH